MRGTPLTGRSWKKTDGTRSGRGRDRLAGLHLGKESQGLGEVWGSGLGSSGTVSARGGPGMELRFQQALQGEDELEYRLGCCAGGWVKKRD